MSKQTDRIAELEKQVESLTRKWNMARNGLMRSHEQRDVARYQIKELQSQLNQANKSVLLYKGAELAMRYSRVMQRLFDNRLKLVRAQIAGNPAIVARRKRDIEIDEAKIPEYLEALEEVATLAEEAANS